MLEGKTVIVTGAARGIGREYVKGLAALGARVAAWDVIDLDETVAASVGGTGRVLAEQVSVTDPEAINSGVQRVVAEFGAIDALVNNAAIYGGLKGGRFDTLSDSDWNACMDVNVKGIWNCCKAVVPHLRAAGGGSIVNVSSIAATYGMSYMLHYTVSKAAVIGITRGLARELGRDRIRVNAIAPSAVTTEATRGFFGDKYEKALQVIAQDQSIPQNLQPEDLVGTVAYLISDASRFVSGQTLQVDGGTVFL